MQRFVEIEQRVDTAALEDAPSAAKRAAQELAGSLRPHARVAVACGSRGIAQIGLIVSAVVSGLLAAGLRPFIVPAMGSHGGATVPGQLAVLADHGIAEAVLGVPLQATQEVKQIASTPDGVPVYLSRAALEADAILPINRVKPHTTLLAPLGSGLMKMISVGLGNHLGAQTLHTAGLQEHLVPAAEAVLAHAPILGGIALVENGSGQVAHLEAVPARAIPERDQALLTLARSYMPSIPLEPLDVLVVRWMGKNLSGTGMDPNVVGLHRRRGGAPDRHIATLVALDLTAKSHGNATGVGMADLITDRLRDKIDWQATRTNCLTGGFPEGMRLPPSAPDDREALRLAARRHGERPLRVAIIQDTLHLQRLWISEARGEPFSLDFGPDGNLTRSGPQEEA
jgi:hypothetical protein